MNKRILLSSASALSALSLIVGGTYAFFSDEGTSNDNLFSVSATAFDLKLSDDTPETDQDAVTASFGGSNMAPGVCLGSQELRAKNTGTIAGNHIELKVVNTVTDSGSNSTPDIDAFLRLDTFTYDGTDLKPSITDVNGNGFKDLNDLENNNVDGSVDLDNLSLTNTGVNHPFVLKACLDATAGNDLPGDSVDSDWTVTLNQDASQ